MGNWGRGAYQFMRVLITGGFGYLGGRLTQFLASQTAYEILLGSRQQTEPPEWFPQAKVVQTRWGSLAGLEHICSAVDAVVHLAGMNAQNCATDSVAALEVNAVATARLLQAAVRQGAKRFIYISTAHVYGSPLTGVITEETCPVSLYPYAASHRAGEDVVRAANQRGEIEGIVIRLSNTFGAPAHKDTNCWMLLVNDLCRQAVTTQRMVLRSSGLQRRNFVPLHDVCRAIDHLLHLPVQDLTRDVFNVGGDWSPLAWEMACLVQERCTVKLGFQPKLTRILPQTGETVCNLDYRFDALRQTGFQPNTNKVEEIDQLLNFCKTSFF
jgi:UDP-glucose 4-epimerase